jgi:acetyl esterase/lipase
MSGHASDSAPAMHRETHVYKTVGRCEIRADAIGAAPGGRRPCVLWIHGGGLIFGSRRASPRPSLLQAFLKQGLTVVSIDHRLAPETKLPAILEDVRDAWRWVREQGPGLLGVDPARLGMAGGSSGAYLALMGGYRLRPRPRALAAFSGFGDITAAWEAEPSIHYRGMPLVSRQEADATVGRRPVSDPAAEPDRGYFYLYCRQQGRWLAEVTEHDPRAEPDWFDRYCPVRNVTAGYPPTVLIHGTADTDVPHEESRRLAAQFARFRVKHEFLSLEGAGHGLAGARAEEVEAAELAAASFLAQNLR